MQHCLMPVAGVRDAVSGVQGCMAEWAGVHAMLKTNAITSQLPSIKGSFPLGFSRCYIAVSGTIRHDGRVLAG